MKIVFDDQNMSGLVEAFENAPLSLRVRELLWRDLSGFVGRNGVIDCSDVVATETGDWRIVGRVGRAGEAFIAALRALAIAGEGEWHETSSANKKSYEVIS